MLSSIKQFVKTHQADIILLVGVILISLLSFAVGYIVAKQEKKEPIRIERYNNNNSNTSEAKSFRKISTLEIGGRRFRE